MSGLSENLSPENQGRIDELADQFESEFRDHPWPRIEDFLQLEPELESHLLQELLTLEIQILRSKRITPDPDDYLARFPDSAQLVEAAFAQGQPTTRPGFSGEIETPIYRAASRGRTEFQADTLPLGTSNHAASAGAHRARRFGDYELLEEIARGGMGIVFKARQTSLNRLVALKMILSRQLAGDEEVKRFKSEAEAAAKLDHPGIVPIFEIGEHEGQHYFSMGFVEGKSLQDELRDGPVSPREAAEVCHQVAEAIAFAHGQGVIHRDLKPGNILISRELGPKLTDFGLAKLSDTDHNLTATGQILGTPAYMPPEQARGDAQAIGPLSDIYSLGAVLYCLLTGRPPFQAADPIDTLRQVIEQEPVSPRVINREVPKDLETVCLKCLEKDPRHRYQSAREVENELGRFRHGQPIKAHPLTSVERTCRWCRRHKGIAILISSLAVAIIAGLASTSYWVWWYRNAEGEARASLDESRRRAATISLQNGRAANHYDKNASSACLWFAGALATIEESSPGMRTSARSLIGGWSPYVPRVSLVHDGQIQAVAFSPDGRLAATASYDQTARLWDARTGQPYGDLLRHGNAVHWVAFSPDGRTLATASADRTARLWDVQTQTAIAGPLQHDGRVTRQYLDPTAVGLPLTVCTFGRNVGNIL